MGDDSEADEGGGEKREEDRPGIEGDFAFGDGLFVGHGLCFLVSDLQDGNLFERVGGLVVEPRYGCVDDRGV